MPSAIENDVIATTYSEGAKFSTENNCQQHNISKGSWRARAETLWLKYFAYIEPETDELCYMPPWTVHPKPIEMTYWTMSVVVALFLCVIYVPYDLAFSPQFEWEWVQILWAVTMNSIDILFIIDMGFNFCTAFIEDDVLVLEKRPIARNYLRSWFAFGFISSAAFLLEVLGGAMFSMFKTVRIFKVFRMLKLLRVFKLVNMMNGEVLQDLGIFAKGAKLLFLTTIISHLTACSFYGTVGNSENSWMKDYFATMKPKGSMQGADFETAMGLQQRYIVSFYWAFVTLSTAGWLHVLCLSPLNRQKPHAREHRAFCPAPPSGLVGHKTAA